MTHLDDGGRCPVPNEQASCNGTVVACRVPLSRIDVSPGNDYATRYGMDDGLKNMPPTLASGSIGEYLGELLDGRYLPLYFWRVELTEFAVVLTVLVHAAFLMSIFGAIPLFFIWLERKVAGRIQDRLGPTRVGGRFGWLQSLADGAKLIQKEDLVPKAADAMLFRMAPFMVCVASFAAFMVLPFSDGWVAVASDVGLFALLAILSLEVLGIIFAGYSSASKWSLFGGMREAAQMVSYEIPLAICSLIPIVSVGTLNLGEIGRMQSGWFSNWLIFHDPFTFVAFFVYFTVATASCKRAPFDLAEAESELVGGFHTEYSGMRWSFFFMAEYASMFLVSVVAALLFLGGWNTGIGQVDQILLDLRAASAGEEGFVLTSYLANVIGMVVICVKASLLVFVQIWVRWSVPRLRIDQVMMTCLKYLIPISCFLFLGATLWPVVLTQALGRTTLLRSSTPLGNKINTSSTHGRRVPAGGQRPNTSLRVPAKENEKTLASASGERAGQ